MMTTLAVLGVVLVNAVVVVLLMAGTALAARRTGRWAVVDVVWGLGFLIVAWVSAVLGSLWGDYMLDFARQVTPRGFELVVEPETVAALDWRPWLLAFLVTVWSGRLAWHIARRARGHGEDPRYEALKQRNPSFVRAVLLPQGVAMWFVSLPVQVGALGGSPFGWLTWVGVLVWAVGLFFESVGDAQLAAYKRDPDRPPVMDRGLWRYTRHPNYFGDACVWWGIWLVAADAWLPGALTVLSPVAMSFFLVFATGAKLLEKQMMQRPGYPEYAARTSMFVPLPPKRR